MYNHPKARTGFFTSASFLTTKLITPILKKHGISDSKLFSDWGDIAGSLMAGKTLPLKISSSKRGGKTFKLLHLSVSDSSTALLLNYQKNLILEKISFYLGKDTIHDLKIIQSHFPSQLDTTEKLTVMQKSIAPVDIEDPDMRDALTSLGNLIINQL